MLPACSRSFQIITDQIISYEIVPEHSSSCKILCDYFRICGIRRDPTMSYQIYGAVGSSCVGEPSLCLCEYRDFCLRLLCLICMECRFHCSGFQAEVDARDESNWSLLKSSALKGHVAVATMLLQATVTVDAADADVWTQLPYAGWNCHAAVADVLL